MKIYSVRVDSVHSDAFVTLSLLNQTNQKEKEKGGREEGMGEEEGGKPRQRKKAVDTIEHKIENIDYKDLDKEICIDPLLRNVIFHSFICCIYIYIYISSNNYSILCSGFYYFTILSFS